MSMHNLRRLVLVLLILSFMPLGLARAEVITFTPNRDKGGFEVLEQSAQGVELKFRLEQVRLEDLQVDGEIYSQISIPGLFLPGQAGAPNLPSLGRMVALPHGAAASLEILGTRQQTLLGIDVLPAPPLPLDTDTAPPAYVPDPAIYGADAFWPAAIAQISPAEATRGVDTLILGIAPFQYNPVRKELIVYSEIHLRLDFGPTDGAFGENRLRSRGWDSILRQNLLNFDSLPALDTTLPTDGITPAGQYEYVILIPDDEVYRAQAERLKEFRVEQGISTGIVTLSETGATRAAIEAWINNAYNNWQRPPDAVLLLGDWVADGGTTGITSGLYNSYCVSDNLYADVGGDNLPDIVFARMTATPANVARMVDKVIAYESDPPVDPGFYAQPLLSCGWQTDRWFCLCSEIVQGFLAHELNKSPVREYAGGYAGMTTWSTNQNTYMLLDYFGPDGLGYIPLTPSYLTDWSGNATGINYAINSGAFITQHRDHGGTSGWSSPAYSISSLAGLSNQDLTYVLSMNCLTGKFNYPSEVFAEAFHRMENGALGVVAATEVSYSFVNDTLVFGMWDYMWPDFDPGHGPSGAIDPRPAFALASAKYYLRDSSWPYLSIYYKDLTNHLFHAHGDAYTTLYTEMPQELTVESDDELPLGATTFDVRADAGAMIALTFDGEILAVAEATGDWQKLSIAEPPAQTGEARLTATKPNFFRYSAPIQIVQPGTLYYPTAQAQSSLVSGLGNCMGESYICQILRNGDLKPLAPVSNIVMHGGGYAGSCTMIGWRCDQDEIDVYINDPGLTWPDWCLADAERYSLYGGNLYDFRGVSVVGCTPLPFYFTYSYRCSSNDDCVEDGICDVATGMCDPCPDQDDDGWTVCDGDCNDTNPAINPGATEVCDRVDNDCDGTVDEGLGTTWYRDADRDGYGDPSVSQVACFQPAEYVSDNTDCDDSNWYVNPGRTELCGNSIDDDCDGQIDELLYQVGQHMEAECGNIVPPMEIQTNGSDTWVTTPPGTPDYTTAAAEYYVEIPASGNYYIWTRVRAADVWQDSFYVEVLNPNGAPVSIGTAGTTAVFRLDVADPRITYGVFSWTLVHHWWNTIDIEYNYVPAVYYLGSGVHTIRFRMRDLGTELEALRVEPFPFPCTGADLDKDGWTTCEGDCWDKNAAVNPGASESCLTVYDDNCNGEANEHCDDPLIRPRQPVFD